MGKGILAIFFFLLVLLLALTNIGVFKHISSLPSGPHQWAQCDRASVARKFSDQSLNFFLPHTHNIGNDTGIVGLEFPLVNWVVGVLYKVFGYHDAIYRIFMFFLFLLAMIASFRISMRFTSQQFVFALIPVLLFALSPVLLFYSANFIPDLASFAFAMMGWHVFFHMEESKARSWMLLGLCLSLSCLIKITSLIQVVAMTMVFLVDATYWNKALKPYRSRMLWTSFFVMGFTVLWYRYASWLNYKYYSTIFLMEMRPVGSFEELSAILSKVTHGMSKQYYVPEIWWLLGLFNISLLVFFRHVDRKLALVTGLLYGGTAAYFMLMARQFIDHDYYIITLLPAVLFNLVLFFNMLHKITGRIKYIQLILALLFVVPANYMMIYCKKNMSSRYEAHWWQINLAESDLFSAESCLDKLGVKKDQKIIFYPDPSPNISLYLLNRDGVPISQEHPERIAQCIDRKLFDYLLIDNPAYLSAPELKDLPLEKIGVCNTITIFKIHD